MEAIQILRGLNRGRKLPMQGIITMVATVCIKAGCVMPGANQGSCDNEFMYGMITELAK